MRKYLAWDIEISKVLPEEETNWQAHMPLGISCMATYARDASGPLVWYGGGEYGPHPTISRDELIRFIHYLHGMVAEGYTIVTWNGLSFDWHQLAFESGLHEECCELALGHLDLMFQILCIKGFPLGLDAVSKGLGLAGKVEGVSGEMAPVLWQRGDYETVLQYVANDAKMTLEVALLIERTGALRWISKKGKPNLLYIPRWLTVRECLQIEEPDTSWMTGDRLTREKITAWMTQAT